MVAENEQEPHKDSLAVRRGAEQLEPAVWHANIHLMPLLDEVELLPSAQIFDIFLGPVRIANDFERLLPTAFRQELSRSA